MNVQQLTQQAYQIACAHGFHDKPLPNEHFFMLIITEVSELVEADRKNRHADITDFKKAMRDINPETHPSYFKTCFEDCIKNSVEDELGDIAIRIFDLAGYRKWTLDEHYEPDWGHDITQFGKSFTEKAYYLCTILCGDIIGDDGEQKANCALAYVIDFATLLNVNLSWHIEQKMRYNALRPKLHGKKY